MIHSLQLHASLNVKTWADYGGTSRPKIQRPQECRGCLLECTRPWKNYPVLSKRKFLGGSVLAPFGEVQCLHVQGHSWNREFLAQPWRELTVPMLVH